MGRVSNALNIRSVDDLVALGRADLLSFSAWPLGYVDQYTLWKWQGDAQEQVQSAYKARLADPIDGKFLALLGPSEHGKTYGIDIPFILWVLAKNRNLRIGIAGSKEELACQLGHGIDRLFKTRGADLEKFGLIPDHPWNAMEKFLQRDDDKLIHPSLKFLGPDTEIQGMRFDVIFLTDFFTKKNQRTPESRRKLQDWLHNTLFPRLEPWGFVVAEGHHVDPEDGYTEMEDDTENWKVIKYRAILQEPSENNGGKATILAPEHWTYKQLARIRARSPADFQMLYQNIPVAREGIVSRGVFEGAYDHARSLKYGATPEIRAAYKRIGIGLDPAFTIKRNSSYSACTVWGLHQDGVHKDLLGGWVLRMLPPALRSKILATILAWNPDDVFIEGNAAQIYLVKDIQKAMGAKASVIQPVYSLDNDPETSVENLMGEAVAQTQAGLITLPYMGQDAQSFVEQMVLEICNFPNGRRDIAMSWNIYENGMKKKYSQGRRLVKTPGFSVVRKMRSGMGGGWGNGNR